ncbi:uncharacterized protein [Tenebrio molitor]|uniref:uncharacterized protein n=1 Tax=Tenebrio molitor TaxID=7067 RepID=UPI0036246E73
MLVARIFLIHVLIVVTSSQVSKIVKHNPLLSRRKRYLAFPMKSNFVITLSFIKPFMVVQPRGFNLLGECDIPFDLPSDTRLFKKQRRDHHLRRRDVLMEFENAFFQGGLNGSECVRRMICEARDYIQAGGKSLVKDILSAIFASSEIDLNVRYEDSCHAVLPPECDVPLLSYILGSLFTHELY